MCRRCKTVCYGLKLVIIYKLLSQVFHIAICKTIRVRNVWNPVKRTAGIGINLNYTDQHNGN